MSKDTGDPAFPIQEAYSMSTEQGMTLRDYFAAKAMEGLLAQAMGTALGSDPKYADKTIPNEWLEEKGHE